MYIKWSEMQSAIQIQKLMAHLVHVFKQQFSVFLEIRVDEKVYENTCNVV